MVYKKLTRMRPGTLGICASIKHKYDVDTASCTVVALKRRNRIFIGGLSFRNQ
jgi:hypothetical protein